ncbi:hypothetical protein [Actinokineospora iranica]|uniref:Uncharacterized protein n=1 Tax=Actinokineospora iranica TaxID=1271860 RepID=A0A1G6WHF6_9PSEU|nr:hypothetical protein [Actinokineospora iranica]SDD65228.1 hypothetical protein SAMN05216174_1155 [Actinokineospora iranica]
MRRIAITVAVASAVVLLSAPGVAAAPGVVRLYSPDGQIKTVQDPRPLVCYRGFGADTAVVNRTSATIFLFPDPGCRTDIHDPVEPGDTKFSTAAAFMTHE